MSTSALIADVRGLLTGVPVYFAGSLVTAHTYGKGNGHYHDVDLFCPTFAVLISTGQRLISAGYVLDDRYSRVWERWLRMGVKTWHTNSLKLHSPSGVEFNLVYKLTDGTQQQAWRRSSSPSTSVSSQPGSTWSSTCSGTCAATCSRAWTRTIHSP